MPSLCAVFNCSNRGNRDEKSFFRIPSIPKRSTESRRLMIMDRREKWLTALKRSDLTESSTEYLRVCEDHFISGKPSRWDEIDHPDWIPSQNMGYDTNISVSALDRYERKRKRNEIDSHVSLPDEELSEDALDINSLVQHTDTSVGDDFEIRSVSTQTDLEMSDISDLYKTMQDLQMELHNVKDTLKKMTLDETSFKENDEKVKYYTGIHNFATLSIIFGLISQFLTETPLSALSKFQKFLLTMMHLRLNLDLTDLSYRFSISLSTASRVFSECLFVMHERLYNIVYWPERDDLMKKVPLSFLETFGRKISVIIDCFEIKIERPGHLEAAAQCYSYYKHSHTIKYLIGISPQGAIIFISSAWGGRTRDKHLVQNSGFLENLLPGDVVLADRGFNVKEEVELYCAELKLPAFTKGKTQLDAVDIETTRNIAHVRIHVERVIGQLRQKFRILSDTMPMTVVKKTNDDAPATVDQIIRVCCSLINFLPSVIPFE